MHRNRAAITVVIATTLAFSASAQAGVQTWAAENFVNYFNYTGELVARGTVSVSQEDETQTVSYKLTGVDPACKTGAGDAANSCGVHIHAEPTCTADAGGHYFTGAVTEDPWKTIGYTATGEGAREASGEVTVTTGALSAELEGRAFVIHDFTGARIACGILKSTPE